MIPYGHQQISEDDIQAVVDVLRSDYLTQGPAVPQFEQAVADYCRVPHAVAVNSGTSALHIACLALGVGPGDRVWTSPNTFVASANCARYCGATVDFVDIDPDSCNMSPQALAVKLDQAESQGTLPKVVIPVHFGGLPCDMTEIQTLANRYGFRIIEDAAHAIGAHYGETISGDCRYSDVTVFSFHPVKVITTGEGGIATTRSPEIAKRMELLRTHGITRDSGETGNKSVGPWYYEMVELGWNYRMTDLQAALGVSQMRRIDAFIARRRELADRYDGLLSGTGLKLPGRGAGRESAWHLYVIGWNEAVSGCSRAEAFAELRAAGIGVNVHYIPVHLQPYYRQLGFRPGQFPNAEAHYSRAITLPIYAGLSNAQQDQVVAALLKLVHKG